MLPPQETDTVVPPEVLMEFTGQPDAAVEALSGGLINHSFKVSLPGRPPLFVQQINSEVFERPEDVQENYMRIWEYAETEFTGLRLPAPVFCGVMTTLFVDEREQYWRAFEFIPDTIMRKVADSPAQAGDVARAFAAFTAAFTEMDSTILKPVIPRFHDLGWRYEQLDLVMQGENYEQMARALPLVKSLQARAHYRHFYDEIRSSPAFRQRVMHHDAKISNVLFSRENDAVVCPVDFDTVMPGYFFSDLGDMIRTMVCPADENSKDQHDIIIRKDYYEAVLDGYLSVLGKEFTGGETRYIHYAGLLMTYMQALRFLTDYIGGEKYYRTSYPGQNLDRARNQLLLLERLEEFLQKHFNFRND